MQDSPQQGDASRSERPEAAPQHGGVQSAGPQHEGSHGGSQHADSQPGGGEPAALPAEAGGAPDAGQVAALAAMAAADPEATRALQAAWGEDLPARLDQARRAARAFASPELIRALEDSGLGDHPALIRVAAEVGRLLDPAPAPAPDLDGAALESLEAEIDQLHALQFARPQEYRSERTQRALARLYARRYGGGVVGPAGRRP